MKIILQKETEHEIQTLIIEYLRRKKFYVLRLNAGSYPTKTGYVRGVEAGTPDLMALKKEVITDDIGGDSGYLSQLYFFDVKVPGNKPTPIQEHKLTELKEYGANCYVVHSLEEVQDIII